MKGINDIRFRVDKEFSRKIKRQVFRNRKPISLDVFNDCSGYQIGYIVKTGARINLYFSFCILHSLF